LLVQIIIVSDFRDE